MKESIKISENYFIKKGSLVVVGLDEVGRGSLAGPVIAAAVNIKNFSFLKQLKFKDSKCISEAKREKLFSLFSLMTEIKWGIGIVTPRRVDKINVLEATKIAMKKAIFNLRKKGIKPDTLLIDGNFFLGSGIFEKPVIRGDETIISCKIAGIIAKVSRDRIMKRYSKKYPEYSFEKNKGYGTKFHIEAIRRLGFSPIHRKSFIIRALVK